MGLDTNNEACHRIYALGVNGVDEDVDGLDSPSELTFGSEPLYPA